MIAQIFLILSACLLSQPPQQVSSSTSAQKATEITVPFEYSNQHIYVTIQVNGKPGMVFMLDSGANKNVLDLHTLHQLGIKPGSVRQEAKVGFGDGRVRVAPEETVSAEIDSTSVAHEVSVVDLSGFVQHFHHPMDGMLGYPFFQKFVVKLDFEHHRLSLYPREAYSYHGPGIKMKLKPSNNFVVIPATLGSSQYANHPAEMIVDTGSSMTVLIYQRFVHRLDLGDSLFHAKQAEAYGLNGYYAANRGSIYSLQIENVQMNDVPVDYISKSAEIHPDKNITGILGNGVLQTFQTVIFDVPHRNIIFEVKPNPLQPAMTTTSRTMGP